MKVYSFSSPLLTNKVDKQFNQLKYVVSPYKEYEDFSKPCTIFTKGNLGLNYDGTSVVKVLC